jgi:hypothetical protein
VGLGTAYILVYIARPTYGLEGFWIGITTGSGLCSISLIVLTLSINWKCVRQLQHNQRQQMNDNNERSNSNSNGNNSLVNILNNKQLLSQLINDIFPSEDEYLLQDEEFDEIEEV